MARGDFKQRVIIEVQDKASPQIDNVGGSFSKLGNFLASKFTITLGDIVGLFKSVASAAGAVVGAAQEQENAVVKLDQSLSSLGPRAGEVSQALQAQAAALEQTTTFSDEAIISNQALAINLGVNADQAGKLTAAAVELSAATGTTLESSFINLARTLNGFRGELGELVPEVAGMTVEQLKAGAALEVVVDRLGGSAAAKVGTFSGVVKQLGNAWGTVQEVIGTAITENEGLRTALTKVRDVISSPKFLGAIGDAATGFAEMATQAFQLITDIDPLVTSMRKFGQQVKTLADNLVTATGLISRFSDALSIGRAMMGLSSARAFELNDRLAALNAAMVAAADKQEKLTVEVEEAVIETDKYSRVVVTAAGSVNDLTNSEIAGNIAKREVVIETDNATQSLVTYEQAERSLRGETDDLTRSLERTARAASQVNAATGGRLTARDRRSQADVDAALAAGRQTTQGGTRIRTADGSGSRLVR